MDSCHKSRTLQEIEKKLTSPTQDHRRSCTIEVNDTCLTLLGPGLKVLLRKVLSRMHILKVTQ